VKTPDDTNNGGLKPPPLPEVTRLNRNVLLVAGMGVAVVVLAVTHVVRSDPAAKAAKSAPPRVEAGAVGSFLNDPPRAGTSLPVPPPAYPELGQAYDSVPPTLASSQAGAGSFSASSAQDELAAYGLAPKIDPREEAYQRALRSALRARDNSPASAPDPDRPSVYDAYVNAAGALPRTPPLRDIASEAVTRAARVGLPLDSQHEFPGADADELESPTYARSRVMDPISEYHVMAGTVLPAMLITSMNSDMPGEILAQISRNVFDSQQHHLLIPRGTKLIGRYDNQIALGQSRVLIAWTRLIFPDGRSLSMPGLPTKDLRGASGVHSQVDNHYTRLYGQAVLLSIIGAGAQLSQPQQSNVLVPNSAGQIAAGALGQELSRISMETIRRNMDVRPTLQVKAGTPFYIFLERDLVLDAPYVDRRAAAVSNADSVPRQIP
jgi:type IV secretory pathway VirB10-like protein